MNSLWSTLLRSCAIEICMITIAKINIEIRCLINSPFLYWFQLKIKRCHFTSAAENQQDSQRQYFFCWTKIIVILSSDDFYRNEPACANGVPSGPSGRESGLCGWSILKSQRRPEGVLRTTRFAALSFLISGIPYSGTSLRSEWQTHISTAENQQDSLRQCFYIQKPCEGLNKYLP